MKILQVIPYFCFGGAETMCENLTYALKNMGHEVTVVSLYNEHTPIAQRMESKGVRILYLDKKLGLDVSMVPKLMKIMKQEKPDAVHTHLDVIKYAALAAKLSGVTRCVHTVHTVAHKEAEGRLQKIINGFYFRNGWSVPVGLSPEVQQTICDFYGLEKTRVPMIFNGIDLCRYTPKGEYSLHSPASLVHVGRFDVPKNHEGMLNAFSELLKYHPDCMLDLVGDGDLRPEMEEMAKRLAIADRVVFHGMQSNVVPFLENADVFVLPSRYEGMPMTIIEAMAAGLPIVASCVGGIPDMVKDGYNAQLIPVEKDAFVNACSAFLQDENMRRSFGNRAREGSAQFSSHQMADNYVKIYS